MDLKEHTMLENTPPQQDDPAKELAQAKKALQNKKLCVKSKSHLLVRLLRLLRGEK